MQVSFRTLWIRMIAAAPTAAKFVMCSMRAVRLQQAPILHAKQDVSTFVTRKPARNGMQLYDAVHNRVG